MSQVRYLQFLLTVSALLVASLTAIAQQEPIAEPPAANQRAYFYLSSDEVRALRDVKPAANLVLKWKRHVEIIEGDGEKPADAMGILSLGPDYIFFEEAGRPTHLIDFALRRWFDFSAGEPRFKNHNLFADVDFFDMEAINRVVVGKFNATIFQKTLPGHEQSLFEASLHVRAQNIAPIKVAVSTVGNQVSIRFKDGEIANFQFGQVVLTSKQSDMLAKALRYLFPIHPAALEASLPLQRLPVGISSLHEFQIENKARTSIQFELVGTTATAYPLPGGLNADISDISYRGSKSVATFLTDVTKIALSAIAGTYGKPRPTIDDYAADAAQAYKAGDRLGSGLAWLAATLHFPDQIAACGSFNAPAFCATFREHMNAAARDSQFGRVIEGSEQCTRREWERGARALASVDVSGKPHNYVVSMLMSCVLTGLPPQKAKEIEGLGTRYPITSLENALKAIEGNPYIPSYYYEIGVRFAMSYENWVAWRLFDLGRALGGGRKGDAFDLFLKQREQYLLSRYPGFF